MRNWQKFFWKRNSLVAWNWMNIVNKPLWHVKYRTRNTLSLTAKNDQLMSFCSLITGDFGDMWWWLYHCVQLVIVVTINCFFSHFGMKVPQKDEAQSNTKVLPCKRKLRTSTVCLSALFVTVYLRSLWTIFVYPVTKK